MEEYKEVEEEDPCCNKILLEHKECRSVWGSTFPLQYLPLDQELSKEEALLGSSVMGGWG